MFLFSESIRLRSALSLSVGFHLVAGMLFAGGNGLQNTSGSADGPETIAEVRNYPSQIQVRLAMGDTPSKPLNAAKPHKKPESLKSVENVDTSTVEEKNVKAFDEIRKEIMELPEAERIDAALNQPIAVAERLTRYVSLCNSPFLLPNRAFF